MKKVILPALIILFNGNTTCLTLCLYCGSVQSFNVSIFWMIYTISINILFYNRLYEQWAIDRFYMYAFVYFSNLYCGRKPSPEVIKLFFMLNSNEHDIYPPHTC